MALAMALALAMAMAMALAMALALAMAMALAMALAMAMAMAKWLLLPLSMLWITSAHVPMLRGVGQVITCTNRIVNLNGCNVLQVICTDQFYRVTYKSEGC